MKNPEIKYITKTPSSYYIALAAWRRGLHVTFIKNIHNYRITSTEKSLFFATSAMVGGREGLSSHYTCKDKYATKHLLQKNNVPTPEGKLFDQSSAESEIVSYAEQLGYPVVVKPNNEARGVDVFSRIENRNSLHMALDSIRSKRDVFELIVEKHIYGDDYGVFVLGEEVIAAYKRTPANVIGDGENTIRELIKIRNIERKKNPHLRTRLLKVDEEVKWHIQERSMSLDSVLPKGETLFLRSAANISIGGDVVAVTDQLPEQIKEVSIKAVKSVPNLANGRVDIIYSEDTCPEGSVLEINSMALIAGHLYPSSGSPQDVGFKMIDFFFPESTKAKTRNSEMFFNMKTVEKHFEVFAESDYTLAPAPVNETIRRTAVIHGDFKLPAIKYKIRHELRRLKLSGFITTESSEQIDIVLSGEEADIELFVEFLEEGRLGVKSFEMINYDKPIVSGFYIDIDK